MMRFKLGFVSLSILFLSACTLPKPEKNPYEGKTASATFNITSSEGQVTAFRPHQDYSIPVVKKVAFKVCVQDQRTRKAITSHKFEIHSELEKQEVISDTNGCLAWSEEIPYDHTAKAMNVKSVREIVARGVHQGQLNAPFSINLWEDSVESLLENPDKVPVDSTDFSAAIKGKTESQKSGKASLWIEDMRLTIDQPGYVKEGAFVTIKIRANMQLNRTLRTGERKLEALNKGDFDVTLSLLNTRVEEKDGTLIEKNIPLTKTIATKTNFDQNFLYVEAQTSEINLCKFGPLRLGFTATPRKAIGQLETFEGVFTVGSCDSLIGNVFSRNINTPSDTQFKLANFINAEIPKEDGAAFSKGRIEFKKMQFSGVPKFHIQGLNRVRPFNVFMCLNSGIDGKPIRFQTFELTKINKKTSSITTDNDGCVGWDDSFEFQYFAPEQDFMVSINVKNEAFGVNQDEQIILDPWSMTDNFARHAKKLDNASQSLFKADGNTHINVSTYEFIQNEDGISYRLDPNLNLIYQKSGKMSLSAELYRPCLSDISGYCRENLPIGLYLVRYALTEKRLKATDSLDSALIHDSGYKILRNRGNNKLEGDFTIETKNIKDNGNTQILYFEAELLKDDAEKTLQANPTAPIEELVDQEKYGKSNTFQSTIFMSLPNNGASTPQEFITEINTSTFVQKLSVAKALQEKNRLSTLGRMAQPTVFASENNLKFIETKSQSFQQFVDATNASLKQYIQHTGGFYLGRRTPITTDEMKKIFYQNSLSEDFTEVFCSYLIYSYLPKVQIDGRQIFNFKRAIDVKDMTDVCRAEVSKKNVGAGISIKKRIILQNPSLLNDGVSGNYKDVSFSNSHSYSFSESVSRSTSFDASLGLRILDAGPVSASFGPKVGISKAWTNSKANQSGYSSNINALEETISAPIRAPLAKYCVTIQLGYNSLTRLFGNYKRVAHPAWSNVEITQAMLHGVMICDDTKDTRNQKYSEIYYIVNQKPTYALGSNPLASRWRPFYIFVRGQEEYDAFKMAIFTNMDHLDTARAEAQLSRLSGDKMKALFNATLGASPGHLVRSYTITD